MIVRPIPGYPGYLATDDGRIIGRRGNEMKLGKDKGGYLTLTLFVYGKRHFCRVNRLVCLAFHGPAPSLKHQAAHKNGIRNQNAAGNLKWATPMENNLDKMSHGTWLAGEIHPRAGLAESDVSQIRAAIKNDRGAKRVRYGLRKELAEKYGVTIHVIKDIALGRSWSGVQ